MMRNSGRFLVSLLAGAGALAFIFTSAIHEEGRLFIDGPLSYKHEQLEFVCESCHLPWQGVSDGQCKKCHKSAGGHLVKAKLEEAERNDGHFKRAIYKEETTCFHCHVEHKGKTQNLRFVEDDTCYTCHTGEPHPVEGSEDAKKSRIKSAVLLTHNAYYLKGAFDKVKCMGCHTGPKSTPILHSSNHLVDVMYNHMVDLEIKCAECHDKVEVELFSAKGGGIMERKCVDCHKKNLINNTCATCHKFHVAQPV